MGERGVLVVDDDKNLRESLCEILEISGLEVFGAASGLEALTVGTAKRPVVVITDFQLPDANGYQVCRNLKTMLGSGVYVIVMTGRILTPEEKETGSVAGVNEYLLKPFDLAAFCRRVADIAKGEVA